MSVGGLRQLFDVVIDELLRGWHVEAEGKEGKERKQKGRQRRVELAPSQMPHQLTYDVAATPIRPTNA
eukprot:scaffold12991_cov80-Skeletonema_dohrnii-CCMP3373.AAC.1